MIELGYPIKKYDIGGTTNSENTISEASVHVDFILKRLDEISEIIPEQAARLKIYVMRSELMYIGVDRYVSQFWNY